MFSAAFYLDQSNEERSHALQLMGYQNMRGGAVVLDDLKKPNLTFKDVPTSLTFALDLEAEILKELNRLHEIAQNNNDALTMDLVASTFLKEQAKSMHSIRNMIARMEAGGNDSIIQQMVNEQIRRKYAPKCTIDLRKLTSTKGV